jgi:hypothetical protein
VAPPKFFKVIACEIALREICFAAAQAQNLVDLEFLPQGLHDTPATGLEHVQQRVNAVPAGKYDAILLGYGLCGNIIRGLKAPHTPLVIPRAHDCITFFLGSKERYQQLADSHGGTYYYTSGWLEVVRRRGDKAGGMGAMFLPSRAGLSGGSGTPAAFDEWVKKYGEEKARYLLEVMDQWTANYSHGALIEFDFTKALKLREQVEAICTQRSWQFEELAGDVRLLQRWLDGDWDPKDYLVVQPNQTVVPSYDDTIIKTEDEQCPPPPATNN